MPKELPKEIGTGNTPQSFTLPNTQKKQCALNAERGISWTIKPQVGTSCLPVLPTHLSHKSLLPVGFFCTPFVTVKKRRRRMRGRRRKAVPQILSASKLRIRNAPFPNTSPICPGGPWTLPCLQLATDQQGTVKIFFDFFWSSVGHRPGCSTDLHSQSSPRRQQQFQPDYPPQCSARCPAQVLILGLGRKLTRFFSPTNSTLASGMLESAVRPGPRPVRWCG